MRRRPYPVHADALIVLMEEGAVAESVAELLSRLRFVGRPVETLYLNETRVREGFIGQVGAIESFTRAAAKAGSVEAPVIKIGADVSSEASVTWTLHDPVAQVLVLRAALESQSLIYGLHHAKPGRYISSVGTGFVSRPGMFEDLHRAGLQRHHGIYETLEADRAKQESVARVIEGPGKKLWLLTLIEGDSVCAAILDDKWLRPVFSHWVNSDYSVLRWEMLGLCRRISETGVPMISILCLGVKW